MYNPYEEMKNSNFIKYMSDNLCNSYFDSFYDEDETFLENNLKPDNSIEKNTTNCLALTIRQDYKLSSLVNVAIKSFRMTCKVLISYFALNIIKLFF